MNKKYLLLILIVIAAPLTAATVTEDDFNRANSASLGTATNGNTWTETGTAAYEIDSQTAYIPSSGSSSDANLDLTDDRPANFSMLFKYDGTALNNDAYIYFQESGTSTYGPYLGTRDTNQLGYYDGSSWNTFFTFTVGEWYNMTFRNIDYSADTFDIYINGTLQQSAASFRDTGAAPDLETIYLDANAPPTHRYDLMQTNLSAIPAAPVNNLTITARDDYTLSSLNNFSATLSNGTTYTTTTGTITTNILSNSTSLYNITVSSDESGGYFNRTYTDYNVSSDLTASLVQARLSFEAFNRVSGAQISTYRLFTSSNGGSATSYDGVSGMIIVPEIQLINVTAADDYTVKFIKSGYYNDEFSGFNATAQQSTNYDLDGVYDHKLNISISVGAGTATENNFTVDIYSDDYDFHEQLSTTSGNIVANLTDGNYTVWLNDSIHTLESYNISLNSSTNLTSVTLDAYTTNTVNVRFLDEETNELIDNKTVTAYFTGSIESYNRTTTNGTLLLEMINPQDYVVTYNADGYSQRQYSFTLTNRTFNELDLYLLNETQDELILTSVQDSFLDPVANAVIRAQKKNLSGTNYYTVETCTTDNSGECLLHLVLYDTTYRFLIIVDGVTVLTSADQTIKQTTLSFRVNLETDSLEEINNILGVTGSLFYDKTNSNIEFTWNDQNSLGVTACLDIDAIQGGSRTDYNQSCTTSASGTIILPIDTNLSYTYEAVGYVTIDGTRYELDRLTVAGDTLSSGLGINGLFIFGFIVIGIAAFTGLWNPVVGPVIMAASVWFFNYIGFITVGTAAATSLIIGAIMVAYLSRS